MYAHHNKFGKFSVPKDFLNHNKKAAALAAKVTTRIALKDRARSVAKKAAAGLAQAKNKAEKQAMKAAAKEASSEEAAPAKPAGRTVSFRTLAVLGIAAMCAFSAFGLAKTPASVTSFVEQDNMHVCNKMGVAMTFDSATSNGLVSPLMSSTDQGTHTVVDVDSTAVISTTRESVRGGVPPQWLPVIIGDVQIGKGPSYPPPSSPPISPKNLIDESYQQGVKNMFFNTGGACVDGDGLDPNKKEFLDLPHYQDVNFQTAMSKAECAERCEDRDGIRNHSDSGNKTKLCVAFDWGNSLCDGVTCGSDQTLRECKLYQLEGLQADVRRRMHVRGRVVG